MTNTSNCIQAFLKTSLPVPYPSVSNFLTTCFLPSSLLMWRTDVRGVQVTRHEVKDGSQKEIQVRQALWCKSVVEERKKMRLTRRPRAPLAMPSADSDSTFISQAKCYTDML